MTSKLWVFRDIDPDRRTALARALSISPATASLLLARGVTTPDEATAWMAPLRAHDPFLIPDIEAAIEFAENSPFPEPEALMQGVYSEVQS